MNVIVFPLFLVIFASALYLVLRSFNRNRMTFGERMARILPPPKEPVIPGTWGEYKELRRLRKNSAVYTEGADLYRRVIPACMDEEEVQELTVTHRIFLGNHQKLNRALIVAFVCFCFGKIARDRCRLHMANVVRYYAKEVFLLEKMSEVMGESCIPVLEGQFLHGT